MKTRLAFLGIINIAFLIYLGYKNNKFSLDELLQIPALIGFSIVIIFFAITTKIKKQK
ncbi:hypothetical protein [Arcicella rigui]|uniref:Uncharacterized protein n=1 Tax=Arcicella rigui TaxID=797020 RepID=A0ABU5QGD7_9BACT|nr:hypothetical protein [Arcicella rigui]MEA5141931.1 hypothetical protein [Arcicella rigui]